MCRWKGCTQPPPPLRISQRLKEFFFGVALYWWPALFFRLVSSIVGSNSLPLMSHSISPPARAALDLEDQPVVQQRLPVRRQRREVPQLLGRAGQHAVVRRVVADDDLHHRDLVLRVGQEPRRVRPHAAVGHPHDVGQVDDVALLGGRAVLVLGEVDDVLAPLRRPQLERVPGDREGQQAAVVGDLGPAHALLAVLDPPLALQVAVGGVAEVARRLRPGGRGHQLELVDPGDRRVQEAEPVLAPLDLQHRVRGAVDGEDVADEAVVGEVLEERLAPPLRVRRAGCRRPGTRPGRRGCPCGSWCRRRAGRRRSPAGCRSRRRRCRRRGWCGHPGRRRPWVSSPASRLFSGS